MAFVFFLAALAFYRKELIEKILCKSEDENSYEHASKSLEAGVKSLTQDGQTCLYISSRNGHLDTVNYFLDKGVDIEAINQYGWNALHTASFNGRLDIVKALVAKRARIDAKTKDGWTALHLASQNGHLEIVKFLQES